MNNIKIIILLLLINLNLVSQETEKIKMNVFYQVGIIQMPIGEIIFQKYKNKDLINLEISGYNFDVYNNFYTYKSFQQSVIEEKTLNLLNFQREVNQNNSIFIEKYVINNNKAYSTNIKNNIKKDTTIIVNNNVKDFLSAFYSIKQIDFSKLKTGDKIPITIILENKLYNLNITNLTKEEIYVEKKYLCNKLSIQVIAGSVFKGNELIYVWISENNIPIQFETNVLIGRVKVYFKSIEYYKYKSFKK